MSLTDPSNNLFLDQMTHSLSTRQAGTLVLSGLQAKDLLAACALVHDHSSQCKPRLQAQVTSPGYKPRLQAAASSGQAYLLVTGESLGVNDPEAAAEPPCLAVRGLLPAPLSPPLSLRLSTPLVGSEFGVLSLGVPELLRRRPPAGDSPGEAALEAACSSTNTVVHAVLDLFVQL